MENKKEEETTEDAVLGLDDEERAVREQDAKETKIHSAQPERSNSALKFDKELVKQAGNEYLEFRKKTNRQTAGPLPVSHSRNERKLKVFDSNERSNPNIAEVKPILRSGMNYNEGIQPSSDGHPSPKHCHLTSSKWECKENIILPINNIKLLNLFRFRVKHETERVRITVDETESSVTFRAISFDELKEVKIKMYDFLDAVVSEVKTLSENRHAFLSRTECMDYLQFKCEEVENIRVLYQADKHRRCIRCYAVNKKDAFRGIQLLEGAVIQLNVSVNGVQRKSLNTSTWISLKKSLDMGLTTVYQCEIGETVVIEGLIEDKAVAAKNKIVQYLKDDIKSREATIILESSKARCFQACLENKLRRKTQKDGSLDVVVLSYDPLKLEVSVEGKECTTDDLTEAVRQIWWENVDFSRMSTTDEDAWLILRGLGNLSGKEFLLKFEQSHNCFIEITTVDGYSDSNICLTSKDVAESVKIRTAVDKEEFAGCATEVSSTVQKAGKPEKKVFSGRQKRRKYKGGRFHHYQAGLSDNEALQMALRLSAESSNTDGCNTGPFDDSSVAKEFTDTGSSDDCSISKVYDSEAFDDSPDKKVYNSEPFDDSSVEKLYTAGPFDDSSVKKVYTAGPFDDCSDKKEYNTGPFDDCSVKKEYTAGPFDDCSVEKEHEFLQEDNRHTVLAEEAESVYQNEFSCKTSMVEQGQENNPYRTDVTLLKGGNKEYKNNSLRSGIKTRHLFMFKTTVKLILGHITEQRADALVNVVCSEEDPFGGTVSKTFIEAGGQLLAQMYEGVASTSECVVVTGCCGQLNCSIVMHVKMENTLPYKKMIGRAISGILAECENWACKSVAFPPLVIDAMLPPNEVAETVLDEIAKQLQGGKCSVKQVLIVINDDENYVIFDEAFQTFKQSSAYMNQESPKYKTDAAGSEKGDRSSRRMTQCSQLSDGQCFTVFSANHFFPNVAKYRSYKTTRSASVETHHRRTKQSGPSSRKRPGKSTTDGHGLEDATTFQQEKRPGSWCSYDTVGTEVRSHFYRKTQDSDELAQNFEIKITAENKETCLKAKRAFERRVKEEFLHEEIIEKKYKVSERARTRIEKMVYENDVKFHDGKDFYILKGQEGRVRKTYTEILKVLLEEKQILTEGSKKSSRAEKDTHEMIEAMMKAEPEAPNYWLNYKPGVSLKSLLTSARHLINQTKFEKVDLVHNRHVFSTIVKMVNATFDPDVVGKGKDAEGLDLFNYKKLFVLKIERIENLDLYEQFSRRKQELYRRLFKSGKVRYPKIEDIPKCTGGVTTDSYVHPALDKDIHSEINEHMLFHGTKEENVITICNDGLDLRISSGNAMFGPGIYAAESATKADQYADDKSKRSGGRGNPKRMFLIRMALGHSYVSTERNPRQFRRPPCTKCLKDDCKNVEHMTAEFGHTYDSVVGDNRKLFREFVVYDSSLCYPEYLITYERR